MLKRLLILAVIAGLVPAAGAMAGGFSQTDRATLHQAQIPSIDLSARTTVTPVTGRQGISASPASTDFRLSDIVSPAMFTQDNVSLIVTKSGGWLASWEDERLGSQKIYLQALDSSGTLSGVNQLMASSTVGADLVDPRIKTDTSGRIYLFYRDQTNGLIYGSRYLANLTVDLAPFQVNDTTSSAFAGPFDFDVYPDGRVVVVWENYIASGSYVYMRLYNAVGSPTITASPVNTDAGSVSHWVPRVAVQPGSGYLVTWEDYRNGQADIYARQFNSGGSAVAAEFGLIPAGPESSSQYAPAVAYSSVDKYLVAWIDKRSGQEIYIQRFDPVSGMVGGNLLVSAGDTSITNQDVDLTVTTDNRFYLTWGAYGAQNQIIGRRIAAGAVVSGSLETKNSSAVGRRWAPSTKFRAANRIGVAWTEFVNNDAGINFMLFDTLNNKLLGSERKLNDDTQGAPALEPSIAPANYRLELVAFTSRRNDGGDIYTQTISHAGVPQYSNQKLNQDSGAALQAEPEVAVAANKSLVVWTDSRSVLGASGQRIFGRFGSFDGLFTTPDFAVSDSLRSDVKSSPRVAINKNGRSLVTWLDQRNGTPQVYGRWLTSGNALDGSEFIISAAGTDLHNIDPFTAADSAGRFFVGWLDDNMFPPTIKGKWYNADKSAGGSFTFASDQLGVSIEHIAAAVNDSGAISFAWIGVGSNIRNLYTTSISKTGTIVFSTLPVTDSPNALPSAPTISVDEFSYRSIAWLDLRGGSKQVYYQMYTDAGAAIGANQTVSSSAPEYMANPATSAYRGRVWTVWSDPRLDGLEVYGNVTVYLPTDADNSDPSVPRQFNLGQNYPNPFNPTTTITFTLPTRGIVTLEVFNLLGESVSVLVSGKLDAGPHQISWNGTDHTGRPVASGVYFYKLTSAGHSAARKMLLLK